MLTALDASPESLDQNERHFVDIIRVHGWFNTTVLPDPDHAGFNYTTGWQVSIDHPELIIFGIKAETSSSVLWDLYREALTGEQLADGTRTDRAFKGLPAYTFAVSPRFYPEYLGWSRWFYGGDDFRCFQLVWPDRDGRFPWDHGADPAFASAQPDLTENGWRAQAVTTDEANDAIGTGLFWIIAIFVVVTIVKAIQRAKSPNMFSAPPRVLTKEDHDILAECNAPDITEIPAAAWADPHLISLGITEDFRNLNRE
eukprot:gene1534-1557_t